MTEIDDRLCEVMTACPAAEPFEKEESAVLGLSWKNNCNNGNLLLKMEPWQELRIFGEDRAKSNELFAKWYKQLPRSLSENSESTAKVRKSAQIPANFH